jgi:glycosyltransferase involved in cell wall biosynthesis
VTLRILHVPGIVGGNPGCLARAERALGLESLCLTTDPNPHGYPVDEQVPGPAEGRFRYEMQRWRLLLRALREFDIIHFNFGRTLFPQALPLDMPMLKAAGKRIFMTYQGDDARQGDYCRAHFDITFATRVPDGYYSPASDAAKRRSIARVARYATRIYALNPDLLHVLPDKARFLPYANVDLTAWRPVPWPDNPVPVVVHAPTHRQVKGTDVVLQAAEQLRREGEKFELVLIENLRRDEARRAYERADLAIDQLFAGWYGGFAVEMMALGKPVLCYLRESDLKFLPPAQREEMPIIAVRPDTLAATLREWLRAPRARLEEIGRRSRLYVEKWHDPLKIAAQLKADYEAAA